MDSKLLIIAFLSPAIAIVVISLVFAGWLFLVISPVVYVIMLAVTLPFLAGLHLLFQKVSIGFFGRLIIVNSFGLLGGAIVYLGLFSPNISRGGFSEELLIQYSFTGLSVAVISFLLYSFGPTRVSEVPK